MNMDQLKQMGRDYFASNGAPQVAIQDTEFWHLWQKNHSVNNVKGGAFGDDFAKAQAAWLEGYKEAMNERESRAINLLKRLDAGTGGSHTWVEAGEFLQEIGEKTR